MSSLFWCFMFALISSLQGKQVERQQETDTPRLLWEENFRHAGSSSLSESNWSFHTGNGSDFGIPGNYPYKPALSQHVMAEYSRCVMTCRDFSNMNLPVSDLKGALHDHTAAEGSVL